MFVPKPNANPRDLFFGRELAPRSRPSRLTTVKPFAPPSTAKPNPNAPMPNFAGTWTFNKGLSQMAASGGIGSGVAEPPIAMTVKQSGGEITIALKYESGASQPLTAAFTLDGKVTQAPDPQDPRPAYNYKRIGTWDGARLVLRTIHGLNNIREVWVLDGTVLRVQRAAQTPGGADSATRNLVYNRGS